MKTYTLLLALVGLLATGCGAGSADPLEATPVASSQVSVRDDVFEPVAVEVPAGTEVTWTWDGDNRHNVTGEPFSSDTQSEGTFSHTFDDAGTYTYRCTLHPGMEGAVVVTDGGS